MPQTPPDGAADMEMQISMIARDGRIDSDDEKPVVAKVSFYRPDN